jgi:hypothetical protein
VANPLGRHATRSAVVARRATHAGDIRAGVAHERKILCGELAGERDEQPLLVCLRHPRDKRAMGDERAQAWPVLVRRVEQHSPRPGASRHVHERGGRETRGALGVGIGDDDDAAVSAALRR